jgi:hypothetical protein
MKISWGTALPLFVESLGEYIEIELAEKFGDLENLKQILNHELPKQARIEKVEEVSPEDKILISEVLEAVYTARLVNNQLSTDLSKAKITNTGKSGEGSSEGRSSQEFSEEQKTIQPERLKSFLNQDVIEVMVKNQSKDIKARIIDMQILDSSTIQMTLRATQRADEILRTFMPGSNWRICKNSQTLKSKAVLQPA